MSVILVTFEQELKQVRMCYCKEHGGSGYGEDCPKCYQREIQQLKAQLQESKEMIDGMKDWYNAFLMPSSRVRDSLLEDFKQYAINTD